MKFVVILVCGLVLVQSKSEYYEEDGYYYDVLSQYEYGKLECPKEGPEIIRVDFVDYWLPQPGAKKKCSNEDKTKLGNFCNGKKECIFKVGDEKYFDDPCPAQNKEYHSTDPLTQYKFLYVEYRCVEPCDVQCCNEESNEKLAEVNAAKTRCEGTKDDSSCRSIWLTAVKKIRAERKECIFGKKI